MIWAVQNAARQVAIIIFEPFNMPDFRPSSVLVTGGAGFIGSHVVCKIRDEFPECSITVLDRLDHCASLKNLESCAASVLFVKGDIRSSDLVMHLLESRKVDAVLHFAAQTHVDNSFGNSLEFTLHNTYGTHVLLEACRQYGKLARFINVSTDEVYGETSLGLSTGLEEDAVLAPTNPYAAAKAGAEMVARAYMTSYALPIVTTRGNNVYGPGQFPEKLVPKFILRALGNAPLTVHGDGSAVRSYLYIDDVSEAFMVVLKRGVVGEIYNIGTQQERSVLDVARDIMKLCAAPGIEHVVDRCFNDRRYYISDKKLVELGWVERTSWEEGLRRTAEWYSRPRAHWDGHRVKLALEPHPSAIES